jgi:hypothetical protein
MLYFPITISYTNRVSFLSFYIMPPMPETKEGIAASTASEIVIVFENYFYIKITASQRSSASIVDWSFLDANDGQPGKPADG